MNVSLTISIVSDTATPAVRDIVSRSSPRRVSAAIGPAMKNLITANYLKLGKNKQGFPSTGFWADAVRATRLELEEDGPLIITDKIGVRLRLMGGTITAGQNASSATGAPTKYITIAATAESYGRTAGTFDDLKFVRFGRGQDAPAALVRVQANKKGEKPSDTKTALTVLYWLKKSVNQSPNPNVLPSEAEFNAAIDNALQALLPS